MRIGIFGSNYQTGKLNRIERVFSHLEKLGAKVWVEEAFYNYLLDQLDHVPVVEGLIKNEQFSLDIALSIGGDGTFLRTAALVGNKGIPILGVNTGRLGFLADISSHDIEDTLDEIFKNYYKVEERTLLQLQTEAEVSETYLFALNEIAILKRDTSSMITIKTYLNDDFLTSYLADGLLIATPTGSTAYSMSVNGPIIIPQTKNIVLSPVAPHSLNVRPLVIPDDFIIRLEVETRSNNFLVALDGRSETFLPNTCFIIKKADFTIKVVKRYNHTFYETLRNKLMWGTDARGVDDEIKN
jgi:NAD+ kinase